MNLISCESRPDGDYKLTVEFCGPWPWSKPYQEQFVGDCTVWHEFPGGRRCSSFLEGDLCDLLQGWKFQSELVE